MVVSAPAVRPGPMEPSLLLTPAEVVRLTNLGRSTVYGMLASGELPAIRVGRAVRVRRSDLEAWIEAKVTGNGHSGQ